MNSADNKSTDQVWDLIDREKKRDRMVRRVSRVAWGVTIIVLLVFLAFTIMDMSRMMSRYEAQLISKRDVWKTLVPFAIILGSFSLIVAILATVGMFLRLRTTTLLEVQQRLANLEQLITSEK